MKLFEGNIKSTGQMTDEELRSMVTMLRQIRADSLTQATKSTKQRSGKTSTKAKATKTVDIAKLMETLTPEQREMFRNAMAKN